MFKFKLKSLLTLKENKEETKKRELGKLRGSLQQLYEEKQQIQTKWNRTEDLLKSSLHGAVNASEIQRLYHYRDCLQKELKKIDGRIQEVLKQITLKQEELKEAMKERKILENLKELHYEEYKKELLCIEQKTMDEIVSYKYAKEGEGEKDG
ncbi:MAG: flagellar export protein FliJ [Cellulosilyticaceae bacterium]